jgi:hypothetical protein
MYLQRAIGLRATQLVFDLGRQRLKLCAVFNNYIDQPPHVDHSVFLWT